MDSRVLQRVQETLPSLDDENLQKVQQCLMDAGVEKEEDLCFIAENDLMPALRKVQARKLIQEWGKKEPKESNQAEVPLASCSVSPAATAATMNDSPGRRFVEVTIPLQRIPAGILSSLRQGKRPNPKTRRSIVRVLVEQAIQEKASMGKRTMDSLAQRFVGMFPCMLESISGEVVGSGFEGLARQLVNRSENVRRVETHKQKRVLTVADGVTSPKRLKQTDQYGCVNWQPAEPPEEEDCESLLEKQQQLKVAWNVKSFEGVEEKMRKTYYLQRKDINSNKTVSEIAEEWPFLFHEVGAAIHFQELTGVALLPSIREAYHSKGVRVLKFLKQVQNREVGSVLSSLTAAEGENLDNRGMYAGLVFLVAAYMKENAESIFHYVEVTDTRSEIKNLPDNPCIVVCGNSALTAQRFMLGVDGMVVMVDLNNALTAIAMLIGAFFNLNIKYPEEASATMEFFQRVIVGINPTIGSKSGKRKGKKVTGTHPKVLSFINKIAESEMMGQF